MFGSNVQPRRVVKPQHEAWHCPQCVKAVARYFAKCPDCNAPREAQ